MTMSLDRTFVRQCEDSMHEFQRRNYESMIEQRDSEARSLRVFACWMCFYWFMIGILVGALVMGWIKALHLPPSPPSPTSHDLIPQNAAGGYIITVRPLSTNGTPVESGANGAAQSSASGASR